MTYESKLRPMAKHLADRAEYDRSAITVSDGSPAFEKVEYGEPKVIASWPYLSVQPIEKQRSARDGSARKFGIRFVIDLVLFHGKIADTLDIQYGTHERAEAVEDWVMSDLSWNFVDAADNTLDKVIFGWVAIVDHPVVVAPSQELWSASRLRLNGMSQEAY